MGLFDSIKGLYSKVTSTVTKLTGGTVSRVAAPISAVAARIDNVIPHPSNGGFQNIVNVLAAPFTGGRVIANTPSKTVNKALELVSNNPFATAAVATGVIGGTKAAIGAIPKAKALISGGSPGMIKTPSAGMISSSPVQAAVGGSPQSPAGGIITASAKSSPSSSSPRKSSKRKRAAKDRRTPRKRKSSKRTKGRRRSRTSSRKKRYGSAKQYARPGGKNVKYTKNGQPYIILASGKARFIKGRRRK